MINLIKVCFALMDVKGDSFNHPGVYGALDELE